MSIYALCLRSSDWTWLSLVLHAIVGLSVATQQLGIVDLGDMLISPSLKIPHHKFPYDWITYAFGFWYQVLLCASQSDDEFLMRRRLAWTFSSLPPSISGVLTLQVCYHAQITIPTFTRRSGVCMGHAICMEMLPVSMPTWHNRSGQRWFCAVLLKIFKWTEGFMDTFPHSASRRGAVYNLGGDLIPSRGREPMKD